jgi:hypothetical protein
MGSGGVVKNVGLVGASVIGREKVGGLAGSNEGTITNSYATGNISGSNTENTSEGGHIGGLVGLNDGTISNSYATGSVTGGIYDDDSYGNNIGGLVGYNGNYGSISSSYATGKVSSGPGVFVGGLVGQNDGGTISSSYFDKDTTRQTQGVGAGLTTGDTVKVTGLSTSNMKESANFAGFDSTSTWFTYDGYTNPLLRTFLTALSVTYNAVGSKTYDGTTACANGITCSYTTGPLTSGKNLLGTNSLVLSSKNAGAVTATGTGLYSDQQGYLITAAAVGNARISKAALTVSAAQVSKTYDGTTSASGDAAVGALAGAGAGESVSTPASLAFTTKGVGDGDKTVRATGLKIKDSDGADVTGNYSISYTDNTSSTISKLAITLSGITAANKTYDGGTDATVSTSGAVFSNKVTGDVLTVSSTGSFATKTAATGKTVTLANTLGGADLDNYSITQQTTASADISKLAITLSGITAANKTYDGGTDATVSTSGAVFSNKVTGDVLTVSSTGSFATKTAATGKTVTLANTLGGADLDNYSITQQTTASADIEKASATVKATANSTTYSGATQTQTGATTSGFLDSDSITVSGLASGKNANTYTSTLAVGGTDATNYNVTITNADLAIAKANATVTANSNTSLTYNGVNQTVSGFTASGLQGGESASVLSGVAASTTYKNAGSYRTTASGTDANYNLSFVDGSIAIAKAILTYTANKVSTNAGNTPTGLSGTVSGFMRDEMQSTATTGTVAWTTPASSASGAGSYAINGSGLSAVNYSFSQAVENATALTLTQSVSIVPVINPPSLPSDTSFTKSAQFAQTTAPLSGADNINTLPATSAGSVQSNGPTVTKALGSSGLLYAQGSGVNLPTDYLNVTPADPAQNP